MKLEYHPIPIVCAGLQPKENLLDLAYDVQQLLAIIHRGDGDTRNSDVRKLDKKTLLDWATASPLNYNWLAMLGAELCNKYVQHHGPARLGCEDSIKGALGKPPKNMKTLPWKFTSPEEYFNDTGNARP